MSLVTDYAVPKALLKWAETAEVKTLPELFRRSVERVGARAFLGQKVGGEYRFLAYSEVNARVFQFASALVELGLVLGDRVANLSNNRPEWPMPDLGAVHAGCIHVPMYSTLGVGDVGYILQDSRARVVVAGTEEHLQRILAVERDCPDLQHVIAVEPTQATSTRRLWTWDEFLEFGAAHLEQHRPEVEWRTANLEPGDVCSFVYTSGTTGRPKGAMLMHGNFVSNATTLVPMIEATPQDVQLSFLPLSHVFERVAYYVMMAAGASIGYAESVETVAADMLALRPTIVPSVPRLFEKIQARVLEQAVGLKARIMRWALGVGRACREARGGPSGLLKLQHSLAHKLVFSKIHERTGGRVRHFISGGAPLRRDVGEFFLDAGFSIIEGYGLTETSPVLTVNPPGALRIGTVGRVIEGVEVRLADDGEICARGPNVMRGYFNRPEATAEALDDEEWFHTGDVGRFDADGYLVITDRKKELLVLSNGKNVAPQPLEQQIKASPWIEQAVVLGDNRNFVSALVVPAFDRLEAWAREQGLPQDRAALVAHEKVQGLLMAEVEMACKDFSNFEKVKKIALLGRELSAEEGELTPTLKIKRRVVNEHFKAQIEGLYA